VGLEGQYTAGHSALGRLGAQKRQHGLVSSVHAIEIPDREGARWREGGMLQAAKDFHSIRIFLIAINAPYPVFSGGCHGKQLYCRLPPAGIGKCR